MGIGGHEFSVGSLAGCQIPFAESTLTAPGVRNKKCKLMENAKKSRLTKKSLREPQQPGDRDHLETACDETRPTRSPTLARFRRSRVCENRRRTALVISRNDECYTHTRKHTHIMAPCTHPGTSREVHEARRPHTCSRPCVFEAKNKIGKNE